MSEKTNSPMLMPIGKYRGLPIQSLPNSYLRWIVQQSFPLEIIQEAKKKLELSNWDDTPISVSRHALDAYSLRFMDKWNKVTGFATFVSRSAVEAWEKGIDVSKVRFEKDGIIKEHDGIKWVFSNNNDLNFKEVITCF